MKDEPKTPLTKEEIDQRLKPVFERIQARRATAIALQNMTNAKLLEELITRAEHTRIHDQGLLGNRDCTIGTHIGELREMFEAAGAMEKDGITSGTAMEAR